MNFSFDNRNLIRFSLFNEKLIDKRHNLEVDVELKAQHLDVTRAFYQLHK